mgnify:CR=1 FL=1
MIRLTEEQRAYIQMNLPYKSVPVIARELNIGYMNVYREAEKMGIPRRYQTKFTPEQDEFIKKWYGVMRYSEIARRLDVSRGTVYNRVRTLGLKKKWA